MDTRTFLLTLALKGTVVLVLAAVAAVLLARASAALRHLAWSAGLLGLLLLPAFGVMLPEIPVAGWRRVPAPEPPTTVSAAPARVAPMAPAIAGGVGPAAAPLAPPPATASPVLARSAPAAHLDLPAQLVASSRAVLSPEKVLQVWAAGAAWLLLWLALGHLRAARIAARASHDLAPEWEELIGDAAELAELHNPVSVRETFDLTVPATVGIFRPAVLVPAAGRGWSEAHRRDVLVHEFAHVRRRDCLTHTLAWVACACHWINPLAWVALWRTRVEREQACDDVVLEAGARPSAYAEELLATAHLARVPLAAGAASLTMARRSQLSTRLLAILDAGRARTPLNRPSTVAGVCLGALAVGPVAALAPDQGLPSSAGAVEAVVAAAPERSGLAVADQEWPVLAPPGTAPIGFAAPPTPVQAGRQALCETSRTGRNRTVRVSRSMSFTGSGHGEDGDGNTYVVWSGPDCSVAIHLSGRVRFNAGENDVESLSRDGRFEATHVVGDRERRYLVRPRNGDLERSYFVDDRSAPLDAEAERWRAAVVLEFIRRSGYEAEARTRRILQASGVDGVLREIEEIGGDWARSTYFLALIASASLDDASAARVLQAASQRVESDHYLASILGAMPAERLNGAQTRAAYLAATGGIESDHYLSQVLTRMLASGSLDPAATRTLLQRAAGMESDHYLATLLQSLGGTGVVRGELLADYLAAAKGIESDHYKALVLGRLVPEFAGQPDLLASALTTAQSIESDHYLGEYLKQVLLARALGGAAIEPFFGAVRTIESDHYRSDVLIAALGRSSDAAVVSRALEAAVQIDSDHYLAEVLLAAKRRGLTEEQQALWRRAAAAIESDHYLGRVMRDR